VRWDLSSDWNTYSVEKLIEDKILSIGDGYRAKNAELAPTGIPFARVGNIDGGFNFSEADLFPLDSLHKVGEKIGRPGDVVLTSKGTVGRFAFVRSGTPQFVYSPQLSYWRSLDINTIDSRFLFYWIQGEEFIEQANGVKSQTDMADYVSLTDQRRMKITLPPVENQRAIARILGALDDKIELNRRMNHNLEEMAHALFKSWFVDFDPVTAKAEGRVPFGMNAETASLFPAEFEETGDDYFSEIPNGWTLKNLDDVASYENGLALQKFPPKGIESLPAIKIRELRQGFADESSDRVSPNIKASCILEDGDIVFSWSGSLMIDLWCGGRGALNQHLFKVTSENYPKWFYYFWTEHHLVDFQDIAEGKATTMGHIQRHHITSAKVVVPSDEVLKKADKVFQPLLNSIIKNRIQIKTLATIRDALLPKLLSGELRVKERP
jgi:type I restriction enzyme S subunit